MKIILWAFTVVLITSCGTNKKLTEANRQIGQLQSANAQQVEKISDYESEIARLKAYDKECAEIKMQNTAYGREVQECRQIKEAIEKNLKSLNNEMAKEAIKLRQIAAKVEEAIIKFDLAGIDVWYEKGLIHIAMSDLLLFKSGSAALDNKGIKALSVLADVLKDNPKVQAYVIGNTDDEKIMSGLKDNWSLSTERANAVVRILRDNYKVDPSRLIAAGRGKYNPIADNITADGRAANRRTDIIINPDLSGLWEKSGDNN